MVIWGTQVNREALTSDQVEYLQKVPAGIPPVEWIWMQMDAVWHQIVGARSCPTDADLAQFYSHPVWLLNGIFTACDPSSVAHRQAIVEYVKKHEFTSIADYGGGFGELSKLIAVAAPRASVDLIEPFPTGSSIQNVANVSNVSQCLRLRGPYDAVVAQDVLEHLRDPLGVAYEIADSLVVGGKAIFANCFCPVIKCHFPSTFHLRHTFQKVMAAMGLVYEGKLAAARHVQVYRRAGNLNFSAMRRAERISRVVGAGLNKAVEIMHATARK